MNKSTAKSSVMAGWKILGFNSGYEMNMLIECILHVLENHAIHALIIGSCL